jgi:hypothetical protein
MNRIESVIQASYILWAKETYSFLIITATANEKNYKETRQIGCLGITDILLFHPKGFVLFLELKKKKGKLLDSQIEFNTDFDKRFSPCPVYSRAVAYGFLEAKRLTIEWMESLC